MVTKINSKTLLFLVLFSFFLLSFFILSPEIAYGSWWQYGCYASEASCSANCDNKCKQLGHDSGHCYAGYGCGDQSAACYPSAKHECKCWCWSEGTDCAAACPNTLDYCSSSTAWCNQFPSCSGNTLWHSCEYKGEKSQCVGQNPNQPYCYCLEATSCPATYFCSGIYECQRYYQICDGGSCEWGDYAVDNTCDNLCSSDGCSGGYDRDYGCSGGDCALLSSTCTDDCCDAHHGDSDAYCSGGVCHAPPGSPCEGVDCPACQYCDSATGNCVNRADGYNDCGAGCQRCVAGACADYDAACSGTCSAGYKVNFDCVNDTCSGSMCDDTCCDLHHGDSDAYCSGGVCYAPADPVCDNDGVCESGEDCANCPNDCACATCYYCSAGTCVARADGYNDCGAGCQRCVAGACADYDAACSGTCSAGYKVNFDCVNDTCSGSMCDDTCCDLHHGDSDAYCSGGVCHAANQPPTAAISCQPSDACGTEGCLIYTGCLLTLVNNSSDPDGTINRTEWDIQDWSTGAYDHACNEKCDYPLPMTLLLAAGNYTAELFVRDNDNASNTASIAFQIKQEIRPDFVCSLDNETWLNCDDPNFKPIKGEIVYFHDNLTETGRYSRPSEGASIITSRTWKKDGAEFSGDNQSNVSIAMGGTTIELIAVDNNGRTASQEYAINVQMPLPEWREIAPFGWIRKLLAGVVDFVNGF